MTRAERISAVACSALALGAFELLLARTSGAPQVRDDLVAAALGWAALGAGAAALAALGRHSATLAAAGLTAFLVLGIALPPLRESGRGVLVGVALAACAAIAGTAFALARRRERLALAPAAPLVAAGAAAAAVWLGIDPAPPAPASWAALAGAVALLALAARRAVGAVAAAALAVALAAWPNAVPAPVWRADGAAADGPDVWLLVVDTLRADQADAMAAAARIGAAGATFTNAHSTSSWTLPAMASLMTGRRLEEHGAWRQPDGGYSGLAAGVATLAERLRDAGWDTAAIVGTNGFASRSFGFERGFESFDHAMDAQRHALPRGAWRRSARPVAARIATRLGWIGQPPIYDADELVRRAIAVHEARRERPLFVWLHFMDVHLPYRHADETALPHARAWALDTGNRNTLAPQADWWSTPEGRDALALAYAHEAGHVDRALGRLLDALGDPPARGRVVVFVADHGEERFEHGGFEHGHALWQELLHVPLRVAGLPGVAPGTVVAEPVDLLDLAPTLLAAAGVAPAPDDGGPGPDDGGRRLDGLLAARALDAQNLLYGDALAWSRRLGARKLVASDGDTLLFDLAADPDERHPLRPAPPLGGPPPGWPDAEPAAELDAATREMLRELGYAEPGR